MNDIDKIFEEFDWDETEENNMIMCISDYNLAGHFIKGNLYLYKTLSGSYFHVGDGILHGKDYSVVDENGKVFSFQTNSFYYKLFKW